jgi:hypothetical protein
MARNKNRQQGKQQTDSERGTEQPPKGPAPRPEAMRPQVTPADIAHKGRQKRFGHN